MQTILSIEDSILQRHLLRRYFKKTSYQLIEAGTGAQGISMVEAHQPDVILLDYHLPDGSGYRVAQQIRAMEDFSDIPIIGITADETELVHRRMLEEGFDNVLTKPIDVATLLQIIARCLENTASKGA